MSRQLHTNIEEMQMQSKKTCSSGSGAHLQPLHSTTGGLADEDKGPELWLSTALATISAHGASPTHLKVARLQSLQDPSLEPVHT